MDVKHLIKVKYYSGRKVIHVKTECGEVKSFKSKNITSKKEKTTCQFCLQKVFNLGPIDAIQQKLWKHSTGQ